MTYIPTELRQAVSDRARGRCKYYRCQNPLHSCPLKLSTLLPKSTGVQPHRITWPGRAPTAIDTKALTWGHWARIPGN